MRVLIIGGAGMVGQKLAGRLSSQKGWSDRISELVLFDVVEAKLPQADFTIKPMVGDYADRATSTTLAEMKPDLIFHLASIVSGDAEMNFERGWNTNGHGSWQLLEALRAAHENSGGAYRPKFVFTSSIAVFGPPFPDRIGDDFLCAPQTSYGAQKAMIELLVADYSRKGMIDGMSIRLPTICVRPGKPNLAASSFFSGIIREPLNGVEAILPVSEDVRHWHASPRSAAGFLTHAADLDTSKLGGRLSVNMPGISCTVAEQIEALRTIAGNDVVKLIRREPDETIMRIVGGWPRNFDPARAIDLGFAAEDSFEEIIRVYLSDDLPGHA
ncbi:MAG: D-erythronate dehydrogenase [Rhizobiaceae bacterium]